MLSLEPCVYMYMKRRISLSLEENLIETAHAMGINISKTAENALLSTISTLKYTDNVTNPQRNVVPPPTRAGRLVWLGRLPDASIGRLLEEFRDFQIVDLQRDRRTAYEKVWYVRKFLVAVEKEPEEVTREDVRCYLKELDGSEYQYKNVLAALKVFFRDFLNMPYVVETFRFPRSPFKPKKVYSKEELQTFFEALPSIMEKALFLLYATSGRRRNEILTLNFGDVEIEERMIMPLNKGGMTKHTWFSFFNEEAEASLREYLDHRSSYSQRIFPMSTQENRYLWRTAIESSGIHITPQNLRDWFCCEMGELGVPDRYIDAFCGRVPRSILARHYTDYSPQRLKRIYDKAGLKVLS